MKFVFHNRTSIIHTPPIIFINSNLSRQAVFIHLSGKLKTLQLIYIPTRQTVLSHYKNYILIIRPITSTPPHSFHTGIA